MAPGMYKGSTMDGGPGGVTTFRFAIFYGISKNLFLRWRNGCQMVIWPFGFCLCFFQKKNTGSSEMVARVVVGKKQRFSTTRFLHVPVTAVLLVFSQHCVALFVVDCIGA